MRSLKISIMFLLLGTLLLTSAFTADRLVSSKTHIKFFSTTPMEDIEAHNYASTSTINKSTGEVAFSVPMQSFEFEKALMQKHFNQKNFLDTRNHPRARFTGKITNISDIDFSKPGKYAATVNGQMTIKGKTNEVSDTGSITITDKKVNIESKFNILLSDYGVSFTRGKPSTNVSNSIEITVIAEYEL